jgi:cyanophycinase
MLSTVIAHILLALMLLTAVWRVQAQEASAKVASTVDTGKGIAVIIGGALSHRNTEVWSRMVTLAGGKNSRWLVFPTAAGTPEESAKRIIESLTAAGARAEMVPLSRQLKNISIEAMVRDPVWIAKIESANGIYFAGGAQEHITAALFEFQDGKLNNTPMLDAIWKMYRAGGVVAGSSAGAAIMSATMFRDPKSILDIMREGASRGSDIGRGLGFVGDALFVDQHFLKRGRIGRMLPVMALEGFKLGLGIEENSAAIVQDNQVEIIGAQVGKGAILADLRGATTVGAINGEKSNTRTEGAFQPFLLRNARISYLDRGDKVNLKTMQVTPSETKLKGSRLDHKAPGFKPYNNHVRFFPDMLGDGVIVNAMSMLVDSPASEVRGLAFEPASEGAPKRPNKSKQASTPIGFEFRFYKTPDTLGYFSSALGGDDYTIVSVGLDITPVMMASPLYSPLQKTQAADVAKADENAKPK